MTRLSTPLSPGVSRVVRVARVALVAVVALMGLVATSCGSGTDTSAVDGISTNEGGITVKPPDVLDGQTDVVDGVDTARVDTARVDTAQVASAESPRQVGNLMSAPDANFTWFDGTPGSLADLAGKPTVLNFWASTCSACIAEMPDFQRVFTDIGDQVAFLGMNTSDRRFAADRLAGQTGVTYPLAEDPNGDVFTSFGLFVMPVTVLLTESGDIGYVWSGSLNEKELRILIDEHIAPGTYSDA